MLNDGGNVGFSLNGKSYPATAPLRAGLGNWVEVTYTNAGMMNHPMHLHGMPQLVVAKDGYPLPAPYLADTGDGPAAGAAAPANLVPSGGRTRRWPRVRRVAGGGR